jgi:osmotically-inducible protein OsmY
LYIIAVRKPSALILACLTLAMAACVPAARRDATADEETRTLVSERLEGRGDLDSSRVIVHINGGTAMLTGWVKDQADKGLIEDVVRRTKGVDTVLSNLIVE